jgi:hypothetical protein
MFAIASVCAAGPKKETRGEQLFREGKEAMQRKEYDVACSKFKESYDDEKALGPLLNHANCEETRQRRAAALELWKLAVIATQPGTEERKFAEERVATLSAALPTLAVRWEGAAAANTVTLDGKPFVADGEKHHVDPGAHEIVGTNGAATVRERVVLEERQSREVVLRLPAEASRPRRVAADTENEANGAWVAGWVVSGIGVASLVAFGATGGIILSKSSEWKDAGCDTPAAGAGCAEIKPSTGLWVANGVTLGVGLAGAGVGVILLATQWPVGERNAPVSLVPGPGELGAALHASF